MDIFKSLRPLILSIKPSSSMSFARLGERRENLSARITNLVNELGPELFPDFDSQRIIEDPSHPLHSPSSSRPSTPTHRREGSEIDSLTFTPHKPSPIPKNESFQNIGSIPLFASHPSSPNHSRSRANSGSESRIWGLGLTKIDPKTAPKANLDEVSRNLHAAMRERGRRRESDAKTEDSWVEFERSVTPMSEEDGKKDI